MSLRIVQPSGEAALDAVHVPWTSCHGAEIKANLPVRILVTVKVPLRSFADPAL